MLNTKPIRRRQFLTTSLMGIGAMAMASAGLRCTTRPKRPNLVLIMADDMGFSDIGCYGGEIQTPNIDGLAARGLRFTQFYNNGICVPTRASLLTGLYSQQVGVFANSPRVYENCVTLAELLKTAGYRTLMVGKWHAEGIPVKRGFDRHFGLCDGCCNFFNPGPRRPGEPEPGRKLSKGGYPRRWAVDDQEFKPYAPEDKNFYTTDAFTDYALDYLDQYGKEEEPFFLYVAYTAPHYPLHAWPDDIAKYRGKYLIGWDKLREQRYQRIQKMGLFQNPVALSPRDETVAAWDEIEDKDAWDLKMAVYAAMIDRMDQNIGRILNKIRALGKEEDTLILFLSDNGGCAEDVNHTPDIPPGPVESYRSVDKPWANASNTPFRKYKATDHEGGICTPFIAAWPKVIKAGITDQVAHLIDIMPTFAELAGAHYPATFGDHAVLPMEGKSLVLALQGGALPEERTLFWQVNPQSYRAVRKGDWKLVAPATEESWSLYDMKNDRVEQNSLAESHSERVEELKALHHNWAQRVGITKE